MSARNGAGRVGLTSGQGRELHQLSCRPPHKSLVICLNYLKLPVFLGIAGGLFCPWLCMGHPALTPNKALKAPPAVGQDKSSPPALLRRNRSRQTDKYQIHRNRTSLPKEQRGAASAVIEVLPWCCSPGMAHCKQPDDCIWSQVKPF